MMWLMDLMLLIPQEGWHRSGCHPPMPFGEMERYLETFRPRHTPITGCMWLRDMYRTFPHDVWHSRRLHPPMAFEEVHRYLDRFRGGY